MADRIGIGIVGAGSIARARHVPGFKAIPGVELVGVVNRSPDSTEKARADSISAGRTRTGGTCRRPEGGCGRRRHVALPARAGDARRARRGQARADAGPHGDECRRGPRHARRLAGASGAGHDGGARTNVDLGRSDDPAPLAEDALGELRTMRLVWGGSVSGGAADPGGARSATAATTSWPSGSSTSACRAGLAMRCRSRPGPRSTRRPTSGRSHGTPRRPRLRRDPGRIPVARPRHDRDRRARRERRAELGAALRHGGDAADRLRREDTGAGAGRLAFAGSAAFAPGHPRVRRQDWRVEAEFIGAIRGQEQVRLTDFATGVRYMRPPMP